MAHDPLQQFWNRLQQYIPAQRFIIDFWRFPEARKRFFTAVWRRPLRVLKWVLIAIVTAATIFLLVRIILLGYSPNAAFSGFGAQGNPNAKNYQSAKTLWDWLQLLIVPTVLAVGGLLFNRVVDQRSRDISADQQRESAWQGYLDKMSELLTEQHLKRTRPGDPARDVATARTLAVLPGLDPIRKGRVLRFLYDSGLIKKHGPNEAADYNPIVSLHGANFSNMQINETKLSKRFIRETGSRVCLKGADLSGAIFRDASLQQIDLREACLDGAYISQTDLGGTWLCYASMKRTRLIGSNLQKACLRHAELLDVNLQAAYLKKADLRGAILHNPDMQPTRLDEANLQGAFLYGADMNDDQRKAADQAGAIFEDRQDIPDHCCREESAGSRALVAPSPG